MNNTKTKEKNNERDDLEFRKERIRQVLEILNQGLYEREDVIKKSFLALIAGESIFFYGPPGVAKSLISRRLKYVFRNASSFEYLMNRFSTPEEIFGPVSIAKLRDEDILERKVEGYLPSANIAFLDEIWKAGPSIQNTLLTIINEKIYRNGSQVIDVPLFVLIAASNELPEREKGLEALWDRFIFRVTVSNVSTKNSFLSIITDNSKVDEVKIPDELIISKSELNEFRSATRQIIIPQKILKVIFYLRKYLQEYNNQQQKDSEKIYVSDRRWKKITNVLKTSAFLNGRNSVDLLDCFLIEDMIWNRPANKPVIKDLITKSLKHFFDDIVEEIHKIRDEVQRLRDTSGLTIPVHRDHINKFERITDNYKIQHLKVELITTVKNAKGKLENIKYIYNWDNRVSKTWVPSVGDKIGLCLEDFRHNKTVKITRVEMKKDHMEITVSGKGETIFRINFNSNYEITSSENSKNTDKKMDERITDLNNRMESVQNKLNDRVQQHIENHLTNLFVPESKAKHILSHIEEINNSANQLLLEIEEIRSMRKTKNENEFLTSSEV